MKITALLTKNKAVFFPIVLFATLASQAAEISKIINGKGANGAYEVQIVGKAFDGVTSYSLNNPAKIIVDIPNAQSELVNTITQIKNPVISNVVVIQGDDRARVVVNMTKMKPYKLIKSKDKITIALPNTLPSKGFVRGAKAGVNFSRGSNGQGIVKINLPNSRSFVDVKRTGRKVVATLKGASFVRLKRLNVKDFGTPVGKVDVYKNKISISALTDNFDVVSYQNDKQFSIELNRPIQNQQDQNLLPPGDSKKSYIGAPLSLNFQNIKVRSVLQLIGDFTNTNIVVSGEVEGDITLRLNDVPWDQALDIILQTKGLSMEKNGDVIFIAPSAVMAKNLQSTYKISTVKQENAPLQQELIQIQYARADRLLKILETNRKVGNQSQVENSSLLSNRGRIAVDKRTNTLIVNEVPSNIDKIRKLVAQLDKPVNQVLVDTRIVSATNNFVHELGVRWGGAGIRDYNAFGREVRTGISAGSDRSTGAPSLSNRLGVNLAASNPFGTLALKVLGSDFLLDMELSAMETTGRGEVISSPRVIAQDGNTATIKSGREIPYTTRDDKGNAKVTFKSVLLSLDVTPKIAPDDKVDMILKVNKDSVGQNVSTPEGNVPSINKNNVETQVLVGSGETVVLGGVYEQTKSKTVSKVPLLGDIPLIGRAFRKDVNRVDKSELLIFVTPRIIDKRFLSKDKFSQLRN